MDNIPGVERVHQKGDFKTAVSYPGMYEVILARARGSEAEAWNAARAWLGFHNCLNDERFRAAWDELTEAHPVEHGNIPQERIDVTCDLMGEFVERKGMGLIEVEHGKYENEILNKAKDLMEGRRSL